MQESNLVMTISRVLLVVSILLGIVNLVCICEHADACRVHKKPRNLFIQKRINRYKKIILYIGMIVLILISTIYLIDTTMRRHIAGPYVLYKIPIPFIVWWTSYKISSKKIRVLKKLRERRQRKRKASLV